MNSLQELAESLEVIIILNCLPGTFVTPDRAIAYIVSSKKDFSFHDKEKLSKVFIMGNTRSYYEDPRFGLIALSEIASRALSPAINDPGTAIAIINSNVKLFHLWFLNKDANLKKVKYTRIEVPEIDASDIFEDAFRPIARDGASNIEVMLRLQKAFKSIYSFVPEEVKSIVLDNAQYAFDRAELSIDYKGDLELLDNERLKYN